MTYKKKEKSIQKTGDMSQSKVKSFVEREEPTNKVVSRGRDITINQKY
ncbi:hypothetical protein [Clostridium beijerinckii]|nr:hypothetical protein [Clostridium beijerinckii]NOW91388.1 hypothetical protein [Clostridium beijerinckii]NRT75774.1 hypothetical protein [Clostridium beijerinckii]OOM48806.1 hypothetical protein CBEIJ_19880 [Clostridium beijerinckii]